MSLRHSCRLLAPFCDLVAGPLFEPARRASLARLPADAPAEVLIDGVGTGLDLPHLPAIHRYTALDVTRAITDVALEDQLEATPGIEVIENRRALAGG